MVLITVNMAESYKKKKKKKSVVLWLKHKLDSKVSYYARFYVFFIIKLYISNKSVNSVRHKMTPFAQCTFLESLC